MDISSKTTTCIHFVFIFCALLLVSCTKPAGDKSSTSVDNPVVTVFDETLFQSDVAAMIPNGLSKQDSLHSAEAFVRKWVNDQLVYQKAKDNISDKDKIDEMVENYRKTLVTYTYLEDLLKENLSKKISEEELKAYYDKNKDQLTLSSNLIKGIFLKIPKNAPQKNELLKYYRLSSDKAREFIEKYSIRNTVDYDYFYNDWTDFKDISAKLPVPIADSHRFLVAHKNFEYTDSLYTYLLAIQEYKLSGSVPPFEFSKPQITDLIVSERKNQYLRKLEEDIYQKATEEKNIKYYKP